MMSGLDGELTLVLAKPNEVKMKVSCPPPPNGCRAQHRH
jgi:hypothetical protein